MLALKSINYPNVGIKGSSSEAMIQSKDGEQMMVSRNLR